MRKVKKVQSPNGRIGENSVGLAQGMRTTVRESPTTRHEARITKKLSGRTKPFGRNAKAGMAQGRNWRTAWKDEVRRTKDEKRVASVRVNTWVPFNITWARPGGGRIGAVCRLGAGGYVDVA